MPAKFSLFTVAALPIIPIALACGGDDGGGGIIVRPDAARTVDAAPVECTASSTYTAVAAGSDSQFAGSDGELGATGSNAYQVYWAGIMDATNSPDFLQLSLVNGRGAFSGGIVPANVTLADEELDPSTCGACILLFTNLFRNSSNQVDFTDLYLVTGGSVSVSSVEGQFTGTMNNVTLTHYVESGQSLVPANDGCDVTIPSLSMNAVIEPQGSGSAAGKDDTGRMNFRFKLANRTF